MAKRAKPDWRVERRIDGAGHDVEVFIDWTKLVDTLAPKAARSRSNRTSVVFGAVTIITKRKEIDHG